MELGSIANGTLEVFDPSKGGNGAFHCDHRSGSGHQAALHQFRVKVCDTHAQPVTLLSPYHRLVKHLMHATTAFLSGSKSWA